MVERWMNGGGAHPPNPLLNKTSGMRLWGLGCGRHDQDTTQLDRLPGRSVRWGVDILKGRVHTGRVLLGVRVVADEDQQLLSGQPREMIELLPLAPRQANPPDNAAATIAAFNGALVSDGERAASHWLITGVPPRV